VPDILMLSAAHPPDDVRIVQKEGAALATAGFAVTHLAAGDLPGTHAHGVALASHGPKPAGWRARIAAVPRMAGAAATLRPAVIQAHEPDSWVAGWLAARRCGAKLILDVHEHYPSRLDGLVPRWLGRPLLTLACRLLGRAAHAVVVAKDGLDGPFRAVVPVRNYATPAAVTPRAHAPGPVALVHLGALGESRGAFTMLAVLARVPEARLVQIGRFTDGSEARFRAAATPFGPRVTLHPWMPREAALALAAGGDIGLVLFQPGIENHRLALPHKLFDAMLAGLPVIVPAVAEEVSAIVRAAGCGLVVDSADPDAVAEAVRELLDPAQRAKLGAAGRAAALGRFGWPAEAARLVALHRTLTATG